MALLRAIVRDFHTAPLPDAERAMLAYVERLTREPWSVREEDVDRLHSAGWDDRAIHDMAQVTAYFNYVNRLADGLGVQLEPGVREDWP